MSIDNQDLPKLFNIADSASKRSQNYHVWFSGFVLALSFFAAVASSYAGQNTLIKNILAWASLIIFILSFFITLYLDRAKFEWSWYNGRAIAESVKTKSWRFMMHSDPYLCDLNIASASTAFKNDIQKIISAHQGFAKIIRSNDPEENLITPRMIEIRNLNFEDRKNIYLNERVINQKKWYYAKADFNNSRAGSWYFVILAMQFTGVIFSIVGILNQNMEFNILSLIAALISASIAWLQIKRHQDLANSYAVAGEELSRIQLEVDSIDEASFPIFVSNTENAISREHTLWIAKRDPVNQGAN
ncbi:DUF4231 domain-containing protein [Deinococcus soli (ex Cha et al. 2016)]|uniref:DUF4231 domain-containing protein n=1 Tax=Deinococcus soli (ex Cha et al. 2016) TaxID=1309411 RepID=UPI00166D07D2|nr:DUF4231 domain-containing protein [Deinococcus soli (ex Cha et al. 2016)]